MGNINAPLLALNRGEVSLEALARVDVDRLRLAAETQINYVPSVLGAMSLRPGFAMIGRIANDAPAKLLPFVRGFDETALIEVTQSYLRVWVGDAIVTRNATGTQLQNPTFADAAGWSTAGTTSGCTASIAAGVLTLTATARGGVAQARQTLSVLAQDRGVEHAIRLVVTKGPVTVRLGSTDGGRDLIPQATLEEGTHSLTFTPTAAQAFLQIESTDRRSKTVTMAQIEGGGVLLLPSPWSEEDLSYLRSDQSGDILYVGCNGRPQHKIERRSERSWSIVRYLAHDGPFNVGPSSDAVLTPGAYYGDTTLSSDLPFFQEGHVGTLFRLFTSGQKRQAVLGAANAMTDAIRVQGIGADRNFDWIVAGTFTGTLSLQRSFDGADAGFVTIASQTAAGTYSHTDPATTFDNVECWYRVVFTTYTAGYATVNFTYTGGGGDRGLKHRADEPTQTTASGGLITASSGGGGAGICRVTSYVSATLVNVEVLKDFSNLVATSDWQEGDWSELQGWPDVPALAAGRMWWFGRDRTWGSVSDGFQSFDLDYEGDAGPIIRSFGSGPVAYVNWAIPLEGIVIGREMSVDVARSSDQNEVITPTTYQTREITTHGAARMPAVKLDDSIVYVDQSGRRVYEIAKPQGSMKYAARDMTRLNLDIGLPGFRTVSAQRQPDTLIHLPRADGMMASLLRDADDEVACWWRIETDGAIEDVVTLPEAIESGVYCVVRRTIGGQVRRFLEKSARRDQCLGRPQARLADCHVIYSGAATTSISGLDHLEGCDVVVWGWNTAAPFTVTLPDGEQVTVGRDMGTFTVSGGAIGSLPAPVTHACVGLAYTARFKSAKLAYAARKGTALNQAKKVDHVGFVMIGTHCQGIEYGQSFEVMDPLPLVSKGAVIEPHTVWPVFDEPMVECPGEWDTDARLCLRSSAPRPATIAAVVVAVETSET